MLVKFRRAFDILKAKRRLILVAFSGVLFLGLAYGVYSYFSGTNQVAANQVEMATLNLELSAENGQALEPIAANEVYPGWTESMEGKITNTGSIDLVFRMQLANLENDFDSVAKAIFYDLKITNEFDVEVYDQAGRLADLNPENAAMNILITPNQFFNYCLTLIVPEDMDDPETSENEDDNLYQGANLGFDLSVESTQANNPDWNQGTPNNN